MCDVTESKIGLNAARILKSGTEVAEKATQNWLRLHFHKPRRRGAKMNIILSYKKQFAFQAHKLYLEIPNYDYCTDLET